MTDYTYESMAAWQNGRASDPLIDPVFFCEVCKQRLEEDDVIEHRYTHYCDECFKEYQLENDE